MKKQNENKNIVTKQETMPVGAILIARRTQRKCLKHTQNGITLVALVITIIVLLILTGVTINLTLGERGIFRTAEKAAKNYRDSQQEEMYGLNSLQNEINDTIGNLGNSSTILNVKVTNIEITPNSDTIEPNETVQLTVKVLPNNATNKDVTWNSSNTDVATVSEDGKVTGVAVGTTTITATAKDGSGVQGSCTINVEVVPQNISEVVEIGDNIEYEANGYSKWKVMYKEEDIVYIVSEKCPEILNLSGMDGYNNGITYLNNVANKYLNEMYADNAKSIGNFFSYETDIERMISSGLLNVGESYWVAERKIEKQGPFNGYYNDVYCVFLINDLGESTARSVYIRRPPVNGQSEAFPGSFGVRPIVKLKNNLTTNGKNDAGEWKLIIND